MHSDSWTRDRVELLAKLWREGRTAAVIAAQLGGLSRSAVLGKVFRLRLGAAAAAPTASVGGVAALPEQRNGGAQSSPRANRETASPDSPLGDVLARRRRRRQRAGPTTSAPATKSTHKGLFELTNACCRWPHGRPGTEKFFFCGAPGADVDHGIPYCARHMSRAYVAVAESRTEEQRAAALRRTFAFADLPQKNGAQRLGR